LLIEVAQTREKNRDHIVTRTALTIIVSLLVFFAIGYSFAFGGDNRYVGGESEYFGTFSEDRNYHERQFMFYFACSLIVSSLVNSSMSERTKLQSSLYFVAVQQVILVPLIFGWAYNHKGGFLYQMDFYDRGGSITVLYTGSLAGLVGAVVLGPRYGRYMKE
jgi:Amt family ammonium transporter